MALPWSKTPAEKERIEIKKILKLENDEFKRFKAIFDSYEKINKIIDRIGDNLYSCFLHDIGKIPSDIEMHKNRFRLLLDPNTNKKDIIDSINHDLSTDIQIMKELYNHQKDAIKEPFKALRKTILNLHEDLLDVTKDIKQIHSRVKNIRNFESQLFHEKKVQTAHLIDLIEKHFVSLENELKKNDDDAKNQSSKIPKLIEKVNEVFLKIIIYIGRNLNDIADQVDAKNKKPDYRKGYDICALNLSDKNFKVFFEQINLELKKLILGRLYKTFKEMETLSNHEREDAYKIKQAIDNLEKLVIKK